MAELQYSNICEGKFIKRLNRFSAEVMIEGKKTICHVKNTGRLKELLIEGATVYLEKSGNSMRKTGYSLISVKKGKSIVNIDSQAPNAVFYEALAEKKLILPGFDEIGQIKRESTYGASRFDFYIENTVRKAYIEVKGVTLENDGIAKFPDAPTLRGVKHVYELVKAKEAGFDAYIIFIIQMNNIRYFTPNDETHLEFGEALRYAKKNGVCVKAFECDVKPDFIEINGRECRVLL
ncbi:sugar fermentation stimulation protein [Thermoclostridium stercorarium subsp. stercorarium DSM 8532]|uniref:Sugar fermentation stimulation protein homolog n=1 Tax=Thermoclostridium stercorarium (strain ATCC 35414 / DSM 8532 / NCIMB 11754) TaxID=1121335 RepID=L7VKP0_THES1|nr:sugar fermentation stimulation protein [Thermoclostridium stercorarium subsp. stercorarium DSM 8532]AGI38137.1 sugar fermentation stimulation protein [Thermoclostridium stercorarium subsp. stercorarium DSM 8532]